MHFNGRTRYHGRNIAVFQVQERQYRIIIWLSRDQSGKQVTSWNVKVEHQKPIICKCSHGQYGEKNYKDLLKNTNKP